MIVIKHRRCRDVILLQVKARRLHGHDFSGAFLVQADLSGASCVGARFPGANLRGADLHDADLRDTIFCGANLRGAGLYGADLRGADLRGVALEETNLAGVVHDRRTRWPEGWVPAPSAPAPRHQRGAWPSTAWVGQGTSRLRAGSASIGAALAALVGSGMDAGSSRQWAAARPGAPWISTLVLAGGMVVAGAAILKQQAATPRPAPSRGPALVIAPHPSHAVDATPLRPRPRLRLPAPARQVEIAVPRRTRPRRILLARRESRPSTLPPPRRTYRRAHARGVQVARREAGAVPVRTARQQPVTQEPFAPVRAGGPTSRRVLLTEYTPIERGSPVEQLTRCAERDGCKKQRREPAGPRVAEAWGNGGFHYGSGYDMYGMHLR